MGWGGCAWGVLGAGVQLYSVTLWGEETCEALLNQSPALASEEGRPWFPPLVPVEFSVEKCGGREDRPAHRRKLVCFSQFQQDLNVL